MPKRFLKHLSAPVVTALDEEVRLFTRRYFKGREQEEKRLWLLGGLRARWRIDSPEEPDRASLSLPIALTMHLYGWAAPELVEGSVRALDALVARIQPRALERLAPELRPLL